jgi:hypothetical protein
VVLEGGRADSYDPGVEPFLVVALVFTGMIVLGNVWGYGPGRARTADWEKVAEALDLADWTTINNGKERQLLATRGALRLTLSASVLLREAGTRIRITGLAPWLEVRVVLPTPGWRQLRGDRGLSVGDAAFDPAFDLRGQRVGVQALLGSEVRRLLLAVFGGKAPAAELVTLADGRLVAQADDGAPAKRVERLTAVVGSLLAIAEGLLPEEALEERLAENARRDPLPSVRLRCLETLLEERPDHAATAAAVRAALADADPGVRLAAALALPAEGRAILLEVARDPASSDAVASRALAFAGSAIEGDALELVLADALAAGKDATVAVCLDGLARDGVRRVPAMAALLESEIASRAAAAARALGATGAPAAAPALARALAHADASVREAAAVSLGRVGATTDDVLALRQAEAAHPWDGTFLRAVREGIASVQSRIVGADHGQLALAQAAGEVSLADDARGRVSPPTKPG